MLAVVKIAKLTTIIIVLSLMAPIVFCQDASTTPDSAQPTVVIVKRGDTLWGFARQYGCTVADIKKANNIKRDSVILGEHLTIPTLSSQSTEPLDPSAPTDLLAAAEPTDVSAQAPSASPVLIHVVKAGETLRTICEDYGVSAPEFIKINKIGAGYRLAVGAKLKIPGRTSPTLPATNDNPPDEINSAVSTQPSDISPDGTSLLPDKSGTETTGTGLESTATTNDAGSSTETTKPSSEFENWINSTPGTESTAVTPGNQNVGSSPAGNDEATGNALSPDARNTNTSSGGGISDTTTVTPSTDVPSPDTEVTTPLAPDAGTSTGNTETLKPSTDTTSDIEVLKPSTDTTGLSKPETLIPEASTDSNEPSELLVPDTSTSTGATDNSTTPTELNPEVTTPGSQQTTTLQPDAPESTETTAAPKVDSSGATVLTPDADGSASENSAMVLSPGDNGSNTSPTGVGGVVNLLDSTPVVTDVVMPTVKKNQPTVTNVFVDTDIKQVLADIAGVAHVVIISDESVKPQNISIEFNKEPLDTALEKVALSGGLVWKERSEGVYLVSSGTPDSPLFREFAMTKRYMPSNMSAEALSDLLSSSWKNYVKVDKLGNMITISAPQAVSDKIERDLKMIDSPLRQIVVDAVIIEMTADTGMDTGFSWNFGKGGVDADQNIVYAKATELDFVKIKALLASGDAKMKANPRVSCFEGRETTLTVGKETFYSIITGNTIYGSSQIQKIATGITLKVTVYVGTDGYVTMKLDPEVGDFTTPVGGNPTVTIRRASTTMRVKSGDTLVIGGLVQELESKNATKVPLLGDLPFIGEIFKSKKTTKSRTDVVMMITPHLSENGAGDVAETLRKLGASVPTQ